MTLSRKPLRGMRELYPPQKRVEDHITCGIRNAGLAYGFEEYEGPALEPLELFLAKSGTELAREQSYNFVDKGDRELILRPELTPSLARMIAASGELILPAKWMSFPDCFRYEKPQRGRVREFLQFNLDILGTTSLSAELEVFLVLKRIMRNLGAGTDLYRLRYSSRSLAGSVLAAEGLDLSEIGTAFKAIDRKDKMTGEAWAGYLQSTGLSTAAISAVMRFSEPVESVEAHLRRYPDNEACREIALFSSMLSDAGVDAAEFDPTVIRGLDYYTGIVFEVTDTGGENRRAICGGGRYDDLVGLFGGQRISGVGFGLGILTLQLFLETYGLIPGEIAARHPASIFLVAYSEGERGVVLELAERLRDAGIPVEIDLTGKGMKKQFSLAEKRGIERLAVIGPDEAATGRITVKRRSGESYETDAASLADTLR